MSETKTGVKIPVGWLRLDRGVTTLPGDWYWDGFKWMPVCRRKSVSDSPMVIRRCRYRVGERVVVWKPSGYSPELQVGLATIKRVYASDHRGVQSVSLLPTGQPSRDSGLNSCNSDILAPVFPIWSDFGSVPDEWEAQDIINKIDPTNDPNVAPYLASETIDEALQQAALTEEPQADPEYRYPHAGDVGKRVEVRDSTDATSDDARWVERTLAAVLAPRRIDGDVEFATCVEGCDIKHICHTWKFARIKIEEPAKEPVSIVCDHQVCELAGPTGVCCPPDSCDIDDGVRKLPPTDQIADADKMVEMPVIKQSLTTAEEPQPWPWVPLIGDWVVRPGGKPGRVANLLTMITGEVYYLIEGTNTKFSPGTLKPWTPKVGDWVRINAPKKSSSLYSKTLEDLNGAVFQVVELHSDKRYVGLQMDVGLNYILIELLEPAKPPQPDHIADANKMVGSPSETPNGSAPGPKPKTLYIAGPMRGIAYFNYPMFDRIAGLLRDQGLHVISPADEDRKQDGFDPFENPEYANPDRCVFPSDLDFNKTVRRCLDAVMQCEEIVLLPGWERSSGAVAELTLAMWLDKRVRHVRIDKDNQVFFVCFWKGLQSLAVDLYDEYLKKADEPGDLVGIDDDEEADDILEEALNITRGSRNASYGPPDQDFRRTAGMWSALFAAKLREGETFEPRDVALAMILLKTSRETHQRKRDNWVDIAGYARCGSLCN